MGVDDSNIVSVAILIEDPQMVYQRVVNRTPPPTKYSALFTCTVNFKQEVRHQIYDFKITFNSYIALITLISFYTKDEVETAEKQGMGNISASSLVFNAFPQSLFRSHCPRKVASKASLSRTIASW